MTNTEVNLVEFYFNKQSAFSRMPNGRLPRRGDKVLMPHRSETHMTYVVDVVWTIHIEGTMASVVVHLDETDPFTR
jgi:hypothetical protein